MRVKGSSALAAVAVAMAAGCGASQSGTPGGPSEGGTAGTGTGTGGAGGQGAGPVTGGSGGAGGAPEPCPPELICPTAFPFHHDGDTSQSSARQLDGYSCAPNVDESGPEVVYRVSLADDGFLSAAVYDGAANVDVDLHILTALDASACVDRGNHHVRAHVAAGVYYIVADTYVDGANELAGPYGIDIGFVVPPAGDCSMTSDLVERLSGPDLQLPATGPMVLEAHLVTVDDGFGSSWPQSITEGIEHHYEVSFGATDFVMFRDQSWCPQENSEFGQGATGAKVPLVDEGWYINMLWSNRPAGGTRMIVQLPAGGPAVVASAGYETGPGNPDHIGGTTEEVHFYLGTGHLSDLRIGFAADQNLPLGPIRCTP
jgi:hypothetical protein